MKTRLLLLAILLVALSSVIFSRLATTYAEAPKEVITLSPTSSQIKLANSASSNQTSHVINQGTSSYKLLVYVAPYQVTSQNYDPNFIQSASSPDVTKWVTVINQSSVNGAVLQPGSAADINWTITVPATAVAGDYQVVLFAETDPVDTGQGVITHSRVGEIIYITVTSDVPLVQTGTVTPWPLPRISFSNDEYIGKLVTNTGNTRFLTTSNVQVQTLFGKTVYQESQQHWVLLEAPRLIGSVWHVQSWLGIYKIQRSATINGSAQHLPAFYMIVIRPTLATILLTVLVMVAAYMFWKRKKKR